MGRLSFSLFFFFNFVSDLGYRRSEARLWLPRLDAFFVVNFQWVPDSVVETQ